MEGWIKLHRKIQDHWLWSDKPFAKGQAWIDILLRVNHEDGKTVIDNRVLEVKRGQTVWSIKEMASRWGWSRKKVSNFLNLLETEGKIKQKRTSKYTLLTIDNYDFYQNKEHQRNIKGTSEEHQKNTNKNDKNEKNINIYTLFDHWNAKGIIKHKTLNKKMESNINARLKEYSVDELKKAIDNYATILHGDQYYWSYKWTLQDFMKPNNVIRFLDSSDPFKAFFKSLKAVNGRQEYSGRYIPSVKETVFDINAGEDWR